MSGFYLKPHSGNTPWNSIRSQRHLVEQTLQPLSEQVIQGQHGTPGETRGDLEGGLLFLLSLLLKRSGLDASMSLHPRTLGSLNGTQTGDSAPSSVRTAVSCPRH